MEEFSGGTPCRTQSFRNKPRAPLCHDDTRRLYYLDWLRIIATLGVFLFHASDVFNTANFEIKNAQQSEVITMIQVFFLPVGHASLLRDRRGGELVCAATAHGGPVHA